MGEIVSSTAALPASDSWGPYPRRYHSRYRCGRDQSQPPSAPRCRALCVSLTVRYDDYLLTRPLASASGFSFELYLSLAGPGLV
jgi:hypothetical protein